MTRIEREGRDGRVVFDDAEVDHLRALLTKYPNVDEAVARITELRGMLALPKGSVHVFSDVHGEAKKLRHVINNASGRLRPLVESLFPSLAPAERREILNLIYYPQETLAEIEPRLSTDTDRAAFVRRTLERQLEVFRALGRDLSLRSLWAMMPDAYRETIWELLSARMFERSNAFIDALHDSLMSHGKGFEIVRLMSRAIRNLSVDELVVAGDLGDRGPRIDRCIEYLMRQPNVSITWGNHDVSWMGACLGNEALIATVVRISLRYGRIAQLEEGYGISLAPLEDLAKKVYADDPCERFRSKSEHLTDPALTAKMQKAAAILQFKLEAQIAARNPHYGVAQRQLLAAADFTRGTIAIDGREHPLLDVRFPTVDPRDPTRLSADEEKCIAALRRSFLESATLWRHMTYLFRRGAMYLVRDRHLIFHGAVPSDAEGTFLDFEVDGVPYRGKALFDALQSSIQRAWRRRDAASVDLFWYLWAGPKSPLFGKDKMATFETYFVAEKATHKETKNPYFKLIHTRPFCERVLREFEVEIEHGLIVNGHVPVKVDDGESPVKDSGIAVTIDGAFSEAYGDRGYTLVLESDRTYIARHHHFESIEAAITEGADIVPEINDVLVYPRTRTTADTDLGDRYRREIATLERLILAFAENVLTEKRTGEPG